MDQPGMSAEILEQAAREVLETTASAAILAVRATAQPRGGFDGVMATITLGGKRGGTLVLYCPRPVAAAAASAMLGLEDGDPGDETILDAMGEIANQVGGTLKRKIQASENEIVLSVPVVAAAAPIAHQVRSSRKPLCVEMMLDGDVHSTMYVCLWSA